MSIYKNGWTRKSMLKKIDEMNGFRYCYSREKEMCVYRNKLGKGCLVGAFIPEHEYKPIFDNGDHGAAVIFSRFPKLREFMPLDDHLMFELQTLHDSKFFDKSVEYNAMLVGKFLDKLEAKSES